MKPMRLSISSTLLKMRRISISGEIGALPNSSLYLSQNFSSVCSEILMRERSTTTVSVFCLARATCSLLSIQGLDFLVLLYTIFLNRQKAGNRRRALQKLYEFNFGRISVEKSPLDTDAKRSIVKDDMAGSPQHGIPTYSLSDIRMSVGEHEFNKGRRLYEAGAVGHLHAVGNGYEAVVQGTHPYQVYVETREFDHGHCNCYLGENDELCKHMIALAIAAVHAYRPEATALDDTPLDTAVCSGEVRPLTEAEQLSVKAEITAALRHIKPYDGPSRVWFQYQDSLTQGVRKLLLALSKLPVCTDSVDIIINLLRRLDRKLLGAVDDSDGTVGDGMIEIVELLNLFTDLDPSLETYIRKHLLEGETFDWQDEYRPTRAK